MDYRLPYDLRDGLLCFAFLGALQGGLRNLSLHPHQRTAGTLVLAAFALFSIDPLIELILFRIMLSMFPAANSDAYNWVYVCVSTPAILLGVVASRSPESQPAE